MIPNSHDLKYFLEISNTLNVSRAAERLGISQPTLSLSVQRLEDIFGTPLLIRSKTGVQLTHAGQKLVSQSRHLLREWEKIREDILKDEEEVRGQYTLGSHPSVALFTLNHVVQPLLSNHPGLELKLVHNLSRKICEDVISFKIDFGIVVNPWNHPDLIIKNLWEDTVRVWTSKKPTSLQDPHSGNAVLICDPELIQSQSILKQIEKSKIKYSRIVTSSSLEVIAQLVGTGAGLGILPTRVATNSIFKLELKPIKEGPEFQDKHCLIFRADAQRSTSNRKLAEEIRTELCK